MNNEEQHEMLCEVLAKLVPILSCEELSLLAYHCGVSINDFYYPKQKAPDLFKEAA